MAKNPRTGLVVDMLINGLVPYLAYRYMTETLKWSEVKGLLWISVIPLAVALVELARNRRIDMVAGFSLFGIVMSLGAALCSSDARMLLIRESYSTLVIAVVFLGSAFIGRPILGVMAVSQMRNNDPEKAERLAELMQDPVRNRLFYLMTYLWGFSMLSEVVLKIGMVNYLTPPQVLLWGPIFTWGITGLTVAVTFWMAHRTRRAAELAEDQAEELEKTRHHYSEEALHASPVY